MNLTELSERQLAIINVGTSRSYGRPGPVFGDDSFVFVPIPEYRTTRLTRSYEELGLDDWVAGPDAHAHYDPEFETMTYGDWEHKARVGNARKLKPGDFLFFFASLSRAKGTTLTGPIGFYLIGYFEMKRIIPYEEAIHSPATRNNAHVRRRDDPGFSVWKGTSRSSLLSKAVPLDRRAADIYLRTAEGTLLPWGSRNENGRVRTDLEVINSATRASRMIAPEHRKAFWTLVRQRNPRLTIFLEQA